jgi:DNA polymerase IV (DinB-like DNA polymerase)
MKKRIIMHIDMDYFFAQVEEVRRPELKDKPVIVGADPKGGKGRGVVSTCNYVARKYGVRSGMPISKAWHLCPGAVFLPVNYELYSEVSARIMKIIKSYGDKFESWGIDEAFIDASSAGSYAAAVEIAKEIKKKIYEQEGLTCSIGIGPNKLIAKIASSFHKPNGLTVVENPEQFLEPLSVRELLWVGPKTEAALNAIGVKTIGELRKVPLKKLIETFGASHGSYLWQAARGIDESPVEEREERKSISREFTFEHDTNDKKIIEEKLKELAKDVWSTVIQGGFQFKAVEIKVRFEDFETHTRSKALLTFTDEYNIIYTTGLSLLREFLKGKKIRLIGIGVGKLREKHGAKGKTKNATLGT